MTEEILDKLGWSPTWDSHQWVFGNLLLWLPDDCDYTLITSLNNYKNTLFKGVIESEEEITFLTKILKKGTSFE